ncbi:Tafazzin [Pseudohyphozyma bogoriensis]|nr:Tafazzin [Pseudohyphozyma bogoriensis]
MPTIPFLAGAVSKLFLRCGGTRELRVEGLPAFLEHVKSDRGILTVANHVSVGDEPTMWGVLPLSLFLKERTVRWTLGAADIMFTGSWDSWFFRKGQVIETFRGKGIYQDAIDEAAKKLDHGRWVHIFPEGRIKQDTFDELRRFKWGISRMLMEAQKTPLIIPIWIRGFEEVMNEERTWPRFLPRRANKITILIGEPLNDVVEPLIESYREKFPQGWTPGTYQHDVGQDLREEPKELAVMRSEMAEVMRRGLMDVGKRMEAEEKIKEVEEKV